MEHVTESPGDTPGKWSHLPDGGPRLDVRAGGSGRFIGERS